jgi:hypothetical protein
MVSAHASMSGAMAGLTVSSHKGTQLYGLKNWKNEWERGHRVEY